MDFDKSNSSVLITDPQNDFFSEQGVVGGLVGESVKANGAIANIETLMKTAKGNGYHVFISPHCYFLTDHSLQLAELSRT
ncbi:MAG: isochorismatase family protein [SAR202 cluster bacterium]|nr:isochorismatase family protein [SAR202 cluster bacterium]